MKRFLLIFIGVLACSLAWSQSLVVGKVMDAASGETLIGANIIVKGSVKGTVTDYEGNFSMKLDPGKYELEVSYVGYKAKTQTLELSNKTVLINFNLESDIQIDEVVIVADIAKNRETPVAFSNVLPAKLNEEIAGRDIPMVLNSTPGVYATEQGGGDGDARITIRGFDQNNVAVMLDGIPVNDMENGWVYWSNWFGLDAVTRNIQVQRGLGASKLALPSVGGTINIITKGVENRAEGSVSQSIDSEGKIQTNIGFTSGNLKHGWGITGAFAYKNGGSWVDQLHSKGYFYYLKIDKKWYNHISSLSAMGAPQQHDQRSYKRTIARYDLEYAKKLGVTEFSSINDMGIGYNQHWGYLKRDRFDANAPSEILNERVNVYHKPQFSLRDYWSIGDYLTFSNILYLSIGTGGGDRTATSIKETELVNDPSREDYGQINWQILYDKNAKPTNDPFGVIYPINDDYSDSLYQSSNYRVRQNNEHLWYGYLGNISYQVNDLLSLSGGIDLRSYQGIHYESIVDLLGGDYAEDLKFVGDTVSYSEIGYVRWGGAFGQAEYKTDRLSAFVNLTTAFSGYKKKDLFGHTESEWIYTPGFTFKTGMNYNLSQHSNVFLNLGYLSKVKAYKYFFKGYTTEFQEDHDNEMVKAIESGYTFGSPRFSINVNGYLTMWQNKPTNRVYSTYQLKPGDVGYSNDPDKDNVRTYADIPGMDAFHIGLEVDFVYKILHNLELQGLVSLGDWTWDKAIKGLQFYNSDTYQPTHKIDFDATGIHVGDAAQTQFGASIRYEPIKHAYINCRVTYFDRYYSQFTPESTTDEQGNPVDSWKLPSYTLVDTHIGYGFKIKGIDRLRFNWRLSVINAFNTKYIADAVNNDSYSELPYQNFDAQSATVFFGAPRRISTSLQISF